MIALSIVQADAPFATRNDGILVGRARSVAQKVSYCAGPSGSRGKAAAAVRFTDESPPLCAFAL